MLFLCVFAVVMWNVYGDCENYATLKGHTGAVMELHYNTDGRYEKNNSCSMYLITYDESVKVARSHLFVRRRCLMAGSWWFFLAGVGNRLK